MFRNAAHIVCLCEASDEYGGIAVHRELAEEYGMIGMVVHPAIQSQSVAIFSVAHMMQAHLLNFYVIIRLKQKIKIRLSGSCMAPFSPLPWHEYVRRIC